MSDLEYIKEKVDKMDIKVDKMDTKMDTILLTNVDVASKQGEQRGRLEGHATQLALLWLIAFGVVASMVAPYFMK